MKRAIVLFAVFLVLFAALLPSPASADNWHRGHRGHVGWWWPGALVGGLVFGAVALATAPLWALGAVAASVVPPPVPYAPPPTYAAPPAYYAAPPAYSAPPVYSAPPAYSAPPVYSAPPQSASYQPSTSHVPASVVQREVVYPTGRYVLHGDGVRQPWQWVWEWAPSSAPPAASTQTVAAPQSR